MDDNYPVLIMYILRIDIIQKASYYNMLYYYRCFFRIQDKHRKRRQRSSLLLKQENKGIELDYNGKDLY